MNALLLNIVARVTTDGVHSRAGKIAERRTLAPSLTLCYLDLLATFQDDNELLPLHVEVGDCVFPEAGRYRFEFGHRVRSQSSARISAMKRFCYLMIVPCVSVAGIAALLSVSNGQSPEPRSILEKAIEAHGGARSIGKPRIGTLKGKSEGEGPEITQEELFDLPKRWKRITSATVGGKRRVSFALMVDGKLWHWDEGMEPQESPNLMNAQPYFASVSRLLDLTPPTVKLSRIRKTKVNGESAVGFRASWDRSEGDYYFSEKTGLLVQATFTVQFKVGKDLETKTVFSDYKDEDGVKLARRRTTYIKDETSKDFVLLSDHVVTELRILLAIPNEVFTLPGKN